MRFQDLIELYEKKKAQYKSDVSNHISELLREAKELYKKDWQKSPTPHKDREYAYWSVMP